MTHALTVSGGTAAAWWAALGVGLVVAVVVWVLLEILRREVVRVDREVEAVWTSGKRVARNTQTTHLLRTTRLRGLTLLGELRWHRRTEGEAHG